MPWGRSGSQFEFHGFRAAIGRLAVLGMAISGAVALSAQQPVKPDAEAAALARRTLAAELALPIEQIRIMSVSPAEGRDSSLGCPQRGMMYTPVLTSGYNVRLREMEREHVVHVAGSRAVICGAQADPRISSATLIATSLKAADAVRNAVSGRLKIEPARVRILSTRPARSDAPPCAAASPAPSGAAFIVAAEGKGQAFRYYTDAAITVSCDDPARKPR